MLDYAIRRSPRARRARITVRDDGEVVVTIPTRAPLRWAGELIERETAWIERHRRRALDRVARLRARPPLGAGGRLPLGGVAHLVLVEAVAARRTRIEQVTDPHSVLHVRLAMSDERPLARILEGWLREQARGAIATAVAQRAAELGVQPGRITIRDQRTRWASASRNGNLSFSWRLVLAPPPVLDYVVVHELVHLVRFGHGPRFWELVRRHRPDAEVSRAWLRRHAHELREALR